MSYGDMPMGMNQLKVKVGTTVKELPAGLTLKFKPKLVTARGRGGDRLRALASSPDGAEWEIEALGLPTDVLGMMMGLTPATTGVTPNRVTTLASNSTNRLPYFDVYGKALGVGADDIHYHLINCKLTDGFEAPMQDAEFTKTAVKGEALDWKIIQNETAEDLPEDA